MKAPFVRGGALALASAIAFGVTTPIVQRFGKDAGAFSTAALLYAGAAFASIVLAKRGSEAPVRAEHLPRILLVALFGAMVAPVALAWGLQRTSAVGASLLLSLEAPFTVLLARVVYREPIGPRVAAGLLSIGLGSALVVVAANGAGTTSVIGAAAIAIATCAWALDNTLARPLAELDPRRVILWKGALGASLSALLAIAAHDVWPTTRNGLVLLACGATGYGASLRLYLHAQRILGAARTGSIFAAAPFVGALAAVALGDRTLGLDVLLAAPLLALGVYLHLGEHHHHHHSHDALDHEHAHRHDDGHHDHAHEPPLPAGTSHSHPHHHDPVTHDHDHAPDAHHGHRHA